MPNVQAPGRLGALPRLAQGPRPAAPWTRGCPRASRRCRPRRWSSSRARRAAGSSSSCPRGRMARRLSPPTASWPWWTASSPPMCCWTPCSTPSCGTRRSVRPWSRRRKTPRRRVVVVFLRRPRQVDVEAQPH
ncbi:unnamed protein product, partial [Prorocentrum cordatum]